MVIEREEAEEYDSDPEDAIVLSAMRRREASDDEDGSGGEDAIVLSAMRRREASDDEDGSGGERTRDRAAAIGSDGESDGQGAAPAYEDEEEQEDVDEEYEKEIEDEEIIDEEIQGEEVEEGLEDVKRGVEGAEKDVEGSRRKEDDEDSEKKEEDEEEEKKENEPYAVPTAGAFYMHDDRFQENTGADGTGLVHMADLDAGPISDTVLYDQASHRSSAPPDVNITIVDHSRAHSKWDKTLDPRVRQYVEEAGFGECAKLRWLRLDWALITALIERWRPETNTFHLRHGEMTITLQDVAVIMGLRIEGLPIHIPPIFHPSWASLMEQYLGAAEEPQQKSKVKLEWLRTHFSQVAPGANDDHIQRCARAYMLHMIGTLIFPDSSKGSVPLRWLTLLGDFGVTAQYSWGSANLAHVYAELSKASRLGCKEVYICGTLVQVWSWERLHVGRPQIQPWNADGTKPLGCKWDSKRTYVHTPSRTLSMYRNELDMIERSQIIWEPYNEILQGLPPICIQDQDIWHARVPIFCWEYLEWHLPDRVLRQFGLAQHIPDPVYKPPSKEGVRPQAWEQRKLPFLKRWNERAGHLQEQRNPPINLNDYLIWYWGITRRWIIRSTEMPLAYMPRGVIERHMTDYMTFADEQMHRMEEAQWMPPQGRTGLKWLRDEMKALFTCHRICKDDEEPRHLRHFYPYQHTEPTYQEEAGPSQPRPQGEEAGTSQLQTQEEAGTSQQHTQADVVVSQRYTRRRFRRHDEGAGPSRTARREL